MVIELFNIDNLNQSENEDDENLAIENQITR